MTICNASDCKLSCFDNEDKCVLHCDKGDYHDDNVKGLIHKFKDTLADYISQELLIDSIGSGSLPSRSEIKNYIVHNYGGTARSQNLQDLDTKVRKFIEKETTKYGLCLRDISFPECDTKKSSSDYPEMLQRLQKVSFLRCTFKTSSLRLEDIPAFYDECSFISLKGWNLFNTKLISEESDAIYDDCTFLGSVSFSPNNTKTTENIENTFFRNCVFKKDLLFEKAHILSPLFNNDPSFTSKVNTKETWSLLSLRSCILDAKFTLDNTLIKQVSITNCEVNEKFEFKHSCTESFEIVNTNFKKTFDLYDTMFTVFQLNEVAVDGIAIFEKCHFGLEKPVIAQGIALFNHVNFMSFASFNHAYFNSGLNIESTIFKEPPNFLGIVVEETNTKRETFRIIKNAFDKTGNHIEANKFFINEMIKYKEELSSKPTTLKNWQEKLVFTVNSKGSEFDLSYIRPIGWCILLALIYITLTKVLLRTELLQSDIFYVLNEVAAGILPVKKILKEGMEFISLIFYPLFGICIWQAVVAIKRNVRR